MVRTAPSHRGGHGGHPLGWYAVLGTAALSLLVAAYWVASTWPRVSQALDEWRGAGQSSHAERPSPSTTGEALGRPVPEDRRPATPPGRPRHLDIPSLGVHAPVVAIDLAGAVLTPPADPDLLGWWRQGALVGASTGTTLITGHTVHSGGGALDDLEHLERGDRVVVTARGRPFVYRVQRVQVLGKGALAAHAQVLFGQGGPARMVLVTCEDWNGREYESNVVVTARPAG